MNSGLGRNSVAALVIGQQNPATLYAAAFGVFKSTDGRRWRAANTALVATQVSALAIGPRVKDDLCGHVAARRLQEQ